MDAEYRRVWNPQLPPVRPRFPSRLRAFIYASGKVAAWLDGKMKLQQSAPNPRPRRPPADKQVVLPAGVREPRG